MVMYCRLRDGMLKGVCWLLCLMSWCSVLWRVVVSLVVCGRWWLLCLYGFWYLDWFLLICWGLVCCMLVFLFMCLIICCVVIWVLLLLMCWWWFLCLILICCVFCNRWRFSVWFFLLRVMWLLCKCWCNSVSMWSVYCLMFLVRWLWFIWLVLFLFIGSVLLFGVMVYCSLYLMYVWLYWFSGCGNVCCNWFGNLFCGWSRGCERNFL